MRLSGQDKTSFRKPLAISLLLHSGLLFAFYHIKTIEETVLVPLSEPLNSFSVLLVSANPQDSNLVVEEIEENLTEEVLVEEIQVAGSEEGTVDGENSENELVSTKEDEGEITSLAPSVLTSLKEPPINKQESATVLLDSASITKSISSYMTAYSKVIREGWLVECIKYQNKHGTKNCPEGESSSRVSRRTSDRGSDIANFETLQSLVKEHGGSGGLNELKQYYYFRANPAKAWTPQKAADPFNPNLLDGSTLGLIDSSGGLLGGMLSIFSESKFELESLINTDETIVDAPEEELFIVSPALFPINR